MVFLRVGVGFFRFVKVILFCSIGLGIVKRLGLFRNEEGEMK